MSRFFLGPLVLAAFAVGLYPFSNAAEIRVEKSKIEAVTVFSDRAEITRQASVQVPAGAVEIVFGGLPLQIETDSLRVTGRGVPAILGAVDLKLEAQAPIPGPEFLAADTEVKRLEKEIAALDQEMASDKESREILRSFRLSAPEGGTAAGKPDPEGTKSLFLFVRSQTVELAQRALARDWKRKEVLEQLAVARAKRDAAKAPGSIKNRAISVSLEAKQAGALTLQLTYVVPNAVWHPNYRATLDDSLTKVQLGIEAVVTQRTGEDWSGVPLTLSTAAPYRGLAPGELAPWQLAVIESRPKTRMQSMEDRARMAPPPPAPLEEVAVPRKNEGPLNMAPGLIDQAAEVFHSSFNAAFAVPGKSDVPADGREHRVVISQESLPAILGFRTVPGLEEGVFMVAQLNAPLAYPLLGGPVRVFAGSAFRGQFGLEEQGPGKPFTLPLGTDNRITAKRVAQPEKRTSEGFGGKSIQIAYAFRTTLENRRDVPVTVVLEDRIPVSLDERIVVKLGEGTTPGSRAVADRAGVLEWDVPLAPGDKREVVLEFTVRWPKELQIGL